MRLHQSSSGKSKQFSGDIDLSRYFDIRTHLHTRQETSTSFSDYNALFLRKEVLFHEFVT